MTDRVGQQFGNYRLLQLLGQGGFAEVYLAEHLHIHTRVAIKLLYGKVTPQDVEAFTEEARTIAALKHPHILRVLDFGFAGSLPFLIMDYAPGGTLRDRHPRGSILSFPTILAYIKQIADALMYAHGRRLIHRDVKPENMLIDSDGLLLLSDFGIVTLVHSTASMKTIDTTGTVHYMAPEQIQGRPRPLSDQYALATVVYEWLCGQRPFGGESTIEIAMKQLHEPPLPLRQRLPSIPTLVEQVVLQALSKDPQQRFATVSAFTTALEQAGKAYGETLAPGMLRVPTSPLEVRPLSPSPFTPYSAEPAISSAKFAYTDSSRTKDIFSEAPELPGAPAASGPAGPEDYVNLCLAVGERLKGNSAYGALVLPASESQIGQKVYLLSESEWIKAPASREKNAKVAPVKSYLVNGRSPVAALFTNLNESGYVVWTDPREPIITPLFPGRAALVIDSSSVMPSGASAERDRAYGSLCQQVEARQKGSGYGTVIVRPDNNQPWQVIYALEEAQWQRSPQERKKNARAAFAKIYPIDGQELVAALFPGLNEGRYVIWTEASPPKTVNAQSGQVLLADV